MIMSQPTLPKIRKFSDKICFVIQNNILCSETFFSKVEPLVNNVEIHGGARQATGGNMAYANDTLDN